MNPVGVMLFIMLSNHIAFAADSVEDLQVEVGPKVIYCAVKLHTEGRFEGTALQVPMQDGVKVATEWHIKISKIRQYWLDEDIAEIRVVRRVEPDLLTRSWLLVDASSGISLRVHDIKLALDFLTHLYRFPALDRSLLLANTPYRVGVNVEVLVGEHNLSDDSNKAWWADLWPSQAAILHKEFSLP